MFQTDKERENILDDAPVSGTGQKKQNAKARKSGSSNRSWKAVSAQRVADMQRALIELYDCPGDERNGGATGIRQQLESKEGLFRMHMMGKRVNFSCRSVIGPDVFLDTNEVGIPESFAKLLTIAEPVTPHNLSRLRAAVLNGPDVYPGANAVEDWNRSGAMQTVKLRSSENKRQLETQARLLARNMQGQSRSRDQISTGGDMDNSVVHEPSSSCEAPLPKRVLRHIRDGDVVLFNRQPTLHRVSIMAHKVRVLPGDRTIRFHYANCASYNADFDGDEMNVHVPQDELARAEAQQLMLSDRHYIVPTSGSPVRGLIQDHILAAALISKRGTFLSRAEFAQLLYAATERIMSGSNGLGLARFKVPIPAVFKPVPLWTGKQLMTAVLDTVRGLRPGINLCTRARVKVDLVGREESLVIFRDGELLQGILDKNAFGASKFGIVHAVQEVYGNEAAGNFLSAVGRLCTLFLRTRGFSTGVDDLILVDSAEVTRTALLTKRIESVSRQATASVQKSFALDESGDECLEKHAELPGLKECQFLIEDMICSKGNVAVGRLDAEMTSGLNALASDVNRCIPSKLVKTFPWNGFSLMTDTGAKGSVVNSCQISCLVGSTILEGQRVPRMGGSGATLPCFAPYDASANAGGFIASRFLTGLAPHEFFFHTLAGREGLLDTSLKTANSGYLQRCLVKHLEGVRLHYDRTVRDSDGSVLQLVYGDDGIDTCKSSWLFEHLQWQFENAKSLSIPLVEDSCASMASPSPARQRRTLPGRVVPAFNHGLRPLSCANAENVSERYGKCVETFLNGKDKSSHSDVDRFLKWRYVRAMAEPGDPLGIIAAQSVGEPSTQMTLNTFHHAGSESKHVTMGIPRLRELLMTATRYPHTPSMTLPVQARLGIEGAQEMSRRLQNVMLVDLLEKVEIKERGVSFMAMLGGAAVHRLGIVLHFPDESVYKDELGFDFRQLQSKIEGELVARLHGHCWKELRKIGTATVANGDARPQKTHNNHKAGEQPDVSEHRSGSKDNSLLDDLHDEETNVPVPDDNGKVSRSDALVELCDSDSGSESGSGDDSLDSIEDENVENEESEVENNENEVKVNGGPDVEGIEKSRDTITDEAAAAIKAWRDAKVIEIEKRGKASDARKSNGKGRRVKSMAKTPTSDEQGNGNLRSSVDASADAQEAQQSDELQWTSSLGKAGEIIVGENCRSVELPWIFPQDITGRIRIAGLVREAAQEVKLASVHRITRCFTEETDVRGIKTFAVATEGSNLHAVLELGDGLLDFDRVMTNDMFGILNCYGVEAMRSALIAEFQKIFGAYGIPVNFRHLALIADYMTARGAYRGFNRAAMVDVPSTFQQMSFETSVTFLSSAVLSGRSDIVSCSPSTAIAIGETYTGGTGAFDLHVPLS
jgi:DNA-directed RNA polymerase I subunit RPA1